MKKTLLVAALVAGFAGAASASTVTLSGELEVGFTTKGSAVVVDAAEYQETKGGKTVKHHAEGFLGAVDHVQEASFALSGSEDLDNGLKAIFELGAEVDFATKAFEVTSAFAGIEGDFGTVTLGLQEDEIYTSGDFLEGGVTHYHRVIETTHNIIPSNPFVKYVGEFSGVKVAANLGTFKPSLEVTPEVVTKDSKESIERTLDLSIGLTNGSVSVDYSKDNYGIAATLGFTYGDYNAFTTEKGVELKKDNSNLNDYLAQFKDATALVGLEVEGYYKPVDFVKVYGAYGFQYNAFDGVRVAMANKVAKKVVSLNLGRHQALVGVGAEYTYKIDDKSGVTVAADLKVSYDSALPKEEYISATLIPKASNVEEHWSWTGRNTAVKLALPISVAYTYDFSARTSFEAKVKYEPSVGIDFGVAKATEEQIAALPKLADDATDTVKKERADKVKGMRLEAVKNTFQWHAADRLLAIPTVSATLTHKF